MPHEPTGAITTYETHALYVGPLAASARHRHHAGQIVWAPEGVALAIDDGPMRHAIVHVVPPHRWHAHRGTRVAAVLWVERDDARWDAEASARWDGPRLDRLTPTSMRVLADALLARIATGARSAPRHPSVLRARRWIDAHTDEGTIRLTDVAAQSGLSVRQLRHRFTEQMGINPSGYLRWRRLRRAIAAIERGASLTRGASEGGFADGAHFCRVFQAQFGVAPSLALASLLRRRAQIGRETIGQRAPARDP